MNLNTTIPAMGDNMPPVDANPLRDRLIEDYAAALSRRDELLASAQRVPAVTDDEIAGKVGDFIKQITAAVKDANAHRVSEKEPYLAGGRGVDGFFKGITDPLGTAKAGVESNLNTYLRSKAAAERHAAEEAARMAAYTAENARQEAMAREAAAATEDDLDAAVQAEEEAAQAQADAVKRERDAQAKAADFSRTRGDYGSVSSLRTFWDFEVTDLGDIPLDALRPHIPIDAIEKGIRSYVKAGGRELDGVRIFENTKAVVR